MIIYKDIITGDELISDSYDLQEIDGVVYEANCKKITIGPVEVNTGANASAEGGDEEGAEDSAETKIDVVYSFRLNETSFDKKSYLSHLKGYMKAVKEKLKANGASDEEVTAFEKGAAGYAKKIVANFKDYEFFIGESMDPDGAVILLNYREDGITPFVTIWKHGLKEEKV
ncbi:translationally-controlled tumor protein [Sphaerulina musiva SO2202]|uniref:Translationally-controlled tumor protein homolog n=1 Tax=Sphaerulina musiva (strain SO2202) TaxID=692275 RepID=M3C5N7_SPHMS|nr:translationally-controlled tumor protein [Sphaerulina musiva SO2202]EMF15586.1 translationally-controlled tumor protein [Sphaerulina musiva SO2202]